MIRRRLALVALVALVAAIAAAVGPMPTTPKASAYCYASIKWPSATGHYGWASNIPSQFLGAVKNGITGWNGISGSAWSMGYVAPGPYGPPAPGSGWYSMTTPSGGFGGAPAITLLGYNGSTTTAANTYLDSSWSWNASGSFDQGRKIVDVTTVVLHEAGHRLTLAHPEDCGAPFTAAEQAAVMHVTHTVKWLVTSDDIAGIAYIY